MSNQLSNDETAVLRWLAEAGDDGLTPRELADHEETEGITGERVTIAGMRLMYRRMAVMAVPTPTLTGKPEPARFRITDIGRAHLAAEADEPPDGVAGLTSDEFLVLCWVAEANPDGLAPAALHERAGASIGFERMMVAHGSLISRGLISLDLHDATGDVDNEGQAARARYRLTVAGRNRVLASPPWVAAAQPVIGIKPEAEKGGGG